MTKSIELGLVAIVAALIVIGALLMQQPAPAYGVGMLETNIGNVATSSALKAVTGVSSRIAATSTDATNPDGSNLRVWTTICTNSATPVALNLDGDKPASLATGQVTGWIAAAAGYNSCFEIKDHNQYNGSITASSTAGSVSVTVKQFTRPY